MITDLQVQHELLKTALEATDNYLAIEKQAKNMSYATNSMIHDFTYEMSRAHDALQALGVLDQHQDYMETHIQAMLKYHGHKDKTVADIPYAHIPQADYGEVEESKHLKFSTYLTEKKNLNDDYISEEEVDQIVDEFSWEDMVDLYEDDELVLEEELLVEKISVQGRLKKRQAFARMRGKRNVARNIKLRRASSINVLKKRAVLAARRAVYKRFLRGRDKSTLSAAEKDRVEQQVARMKYMQQAIATKLLPKMRSIEQKRLTGYRVNKISATGRRGSKAPGGTKSKGKR